MSAQTAHRRMWCWKADNGSQVVVEVEVVGEEVEVEEVELCKGPGCLGLCSPSH